MFDSSWGVDVSVSTPRMLSALVEEAVTVGDLVRLFSLRAGEANLVEITLPANSPCVGKRVADIELPEDSALAAILRDGRVLTPKPEDAFATGDELIIIAAASAEPLLQQCFAPEH